MKNNEMRSYLSLIPLSAKQRRKQNRLTLLCIILAVFLVTSIFSLVDIWLNGENEAMVKRHGNYHIILRGISDEQAQRIAAQDNVSAAAWCGQFGDDIYEGYEAGGKKAVFYGAQLSYLYEIRNYETEGEWPRNENEVMLSAEAEEEQGIHLGDTCVIRTPAGDLSYTVSGFCADDTIYNDSIGGVCVYMNVGALQSLCESNGEDVSLEFYVQFSKGTNLRRAIADIKEQYALDDAAVEENMITVGMSGASTREEFVNLYGLAAVLFVLVLLAGVLMISGCMNSNIAQRTRFFGMLRCIGASRKQVMRFVHLEAFNWCKTAIPVGCALSLVCTWGVCEILQNLVQGEFAEFSFRISPVGIVCGILVGMVTVLLAAHAPAKRAASVSPVAAVTGDAESEQSIVRAADTRLLKVESALGIHHAVSAKKNLILLTLSFALTVTLFLAFSACFDIIRKLLPSVSSFSPDLEIVSADNTNSIDKSIKEKIAALGGVEEVLGIAIAFEVPAKINGAPGIIDLVSYNDFMFESVEKSVVSGELSKITDGSDYVMTIFNEGSSLNTGDLIQLEDTRLEVACVASEGIGGWGNPLVVCTEETFLRLTGEDNYMLVDAVLSKDAEETAVHEIEALAGENIFTDRREEKMDSYRGYWVFRVAAYGFLLIIALITVLNIMNSISMSVTARIKQYGAMRAVGMSVGQMTKMIVAEALTYAVCGMALGLVGGLFVHRLITVKLLVTHFGGTWRIPLKPIGEILLLFALSCTAAVYAPVKRLRCMAITDTVNEL